MRPNRNNLRERDSSGMLSKVKGMIRRAVVSDTANVLWQLLGFEGLGVDEREDDPAEVFDNIGYHSRPPATGRPEVIRVNVGGDPNNIVVIGSRDRETLAAVLQALKSADVLGADETLLYNSQAVVHVAGSEVHAKTPGGTAVALATKDELQDLVNDYNLHKHTGVTAGGGISGITDTLASNPSGTTVLKGE